MTADRLHFKDDMISEGARSVCESIQRAGYQAWLVGGAIRDCVLGRNPHDWDIATNATPKEIFGLFSHVIPTGEKHGTVTVMLGTDSYEVTTFRGDGNYSDGRRPDTVSFVETIEQDLARRDFTMNAIAYNPIANTWADPFDGKKDAINGVIRTVGNPLHRFNEDGLRVMRACRFVSTLGMSISPETEAAIPSALSTLSMVAAERIRDEILKTLSGKTPSISFELMKSTGVLGVVLPEMLPLIGCTQNRYHAHDVWTHTMLVVDALPANDPILRMTGLLHDIAKPQSKGVHVKTGDATFYEHDSLGEGVSKSILSRLKFSNAEISRVSHLIRHHVVLYQHGDTKASIRRWMRRVGVDHIQDLFTIARADIFGKGDAAKKLGTELIDELEVRTSDIKLNDPAPQSTSALAIDGDTVKSVLGIGPGPKVGSALKYLLEIVTDQPELNTKEQLSAALLTWDQNGSPQTL